MRVSNPEWPQASSCNAADIDLDGWQDFFVTNGFDPSSGPNVMFRNLGDGSFADVTSAIGDGAFDGRGVAFADLDSDGDLGLVVTANAGQSTRLWRDDTANGHHWLVLKLEGTRSNRSAIGARAEVTTALGTQVQRVSGGAGRGSQNSLPVEFGLGTADAVESVTIRWPSGIVQVLYDLEVDRMHSVVERESLPAPLRRFPSRRVRP